MSFNLVMLLLQILISFAATEDVSFIYHGLRSANLSLDGAAEVTSNGLLKLTNNTKQEEGHAFYLSPVNFKNSQNGSAFSFSTSFVFAIEPQYSTLGGHGIVFVIAPIRGLPGALPSKHLGLFNLTNNGNSTNHVVGVELDTVENSEFKDIDDNHVGVDINDLVSELAEPAGYYDRQGKFHGLSLISGRPLRCWIEYNGVTKRINVTLSPLGVDKPSIPLLSLRHDISSIVHRNMYIGFSSSTGSVVASHYILGWTFKINGEPEEFNLSLLPEIPCVGSKGKAKLLAIGLPAMLTAPMVLAIVGVVYLVRRKRKYAEVVEDWELEHGPHRFKYKDLYIATKGFRGKELLGSGGFGSVYRGVLPTSKIEIAVKRVSHESREGMREFVAEIVSIGKLRHRNLVPLLGYCRRKRELFLVYECIPNGSLDKFLHEQPRFTLNWNQRFQVIKGVASGLLYLHEEWEKVVLHRDIKASNVLLDGEFNGRLGDFGLAKLYDHGASPETTHVVGTLGYLAPELSRTGKATTRSDVYSFGAFLLEVVCGRRPIELRETSEYLILVDAVYTWWKRGDILKAVDPKLGLEYVPQEVELVLKLGLLCSHSEPTARPSMRQVVAYLEGAIALPNLSLLGNSANGLTFAHREGFDHCIQSCHSVKRAFPHTSSVAESFLSEGR